MRSESKESNREVVCDLQLCGFLSGVDLCEATWLGIDDKVADEEVKRNPMSSEVKKGKS